jgi:hypothetical protein
MAVMGSLMSTMRMARMFVVTVVTMSAITAGMCDMTTGPLESIVISV